LRYNTEIKERLNREHGTNLELSSQARELQRELAESKKAVSALTGRAEAAEATARGQTDRGNELDKKLSETKLMLEQLQYEGQLKQEQNKSTVEAKDTKMLEVREIIAMNRGTFLFLTCVYF
jgi:hypothetical protein